jgi:alpha-L-fucosidase
MNSWGYRIEEDYFSSKHLIRCIDRTLCLGGNYLLNIGPKSDGTIGKEFTDCLKKVGKWYTMAKEAFRDTDAVSSAIDNKNVFATRKENCIYLHFYEDPKGSAVEIVPLDILPEKVVLLNDGRTLEAKRDMSTKCWKDVMGYLRIRQLPVEEFYNTVMIVKLEYKKLPKRFLDASVSDARIEEGQIHKQAMD